MNKWVKTWIVLTLVWAFLVWLLIESLGVVSLEDKWKLFLYVISGPTLFVLAVGYGVAWIRR
jgi:hypothetical protein